MKQEARQSSSVNTVTFCPTNHIRARKLASHLHPGRWQTHQCLKRVKGGQGTGKLKRETICLQYTHLSVHSITCQNANTTSQWAGNIQKLRLQRDKGKIQKKFNTFSRFLPKFCQLAWDNTYLCSSQYSEAVGCAPPAASSPKSRSVFTFPFVPIPPRSPATKRHLLLSLITQVQILALCHHKAPLLRLSKEKEVFPTQRNSVLFPQEMGGMFSPFLPTPVPPAPQGGWTSSSPGHIFQRGLKGLVCRITSSLSLQGVGLLPKALLLPLSRGRGQSLIPHSNRDFQKDFPHSTALVPSYF